MLAQRRDQAVRVGAKAESGLRLDPALSGQARLVACVRLHERDAWHHDSPHAHGRPLWALAVTAGLKGLPRPG